MSAFPAFPVSSVVFLTYCSGFAQFGCNGVTVEKDDIIVSLLHWGQTAHGLVYCPETQALPALATVLGAHLEGFRFWLRFISLGSMPPALQLPYQCVVINVPGPACLALPQQSPFSANCRSQALHKIFSTWLQLPRGDECIVVCV